MVAKIEIKRRGSGRGCNALQSYYHLLRSLNSAVSVAEAREQTGINSVDTSEFWKLHCVKYWLRTQAEKGRGARRGYLASRNVGPQITPEKKKYGEERGRKPLTPICVSFLSLYQEGRVRTKAPRHLFLWVRKTRQRRQKCKPPSTAREVLAAALQQFVRKVSGLQKRNAKRASRAREKTGEGSRPARDREALSRAGRPAVMAAQPRESLD